MGVFASECAEACRSRVSSGVKRDREVLPVVVGTESQMASASWRHWVLEYPEVMERV